LIVDDEDRLREVVRLTLELLAGWRILGANSGQVGIELARSHRPDAILLDLMMPEMDGFATLRTLQANAETAKIPVLLLTARDSVGYSDEVADVEVVAHIPKPFDTLHLAEQIAAHLGWEL